MPTGRIKMYFNRHFIFYARLVIAYAVFNRHSAIISGMNQKRRWRIFCHLQLV